MPPVDVDGRQWLASDDLTVRDIAAMQASTINTSMFRLLTVLERSHHKALVHMSTTWAQSKGGVIKWISKSLATAPQFNLRCSQ